MQATGQSVLAYARAKLFDPLGIVTRPASEPPFDEAHAPDYDRAGFAWPVDPQGFHTTAFFLKLRPRDMATFARHRRRRSRDWNGVRPHGEVQRTRRATYELRNETGETALDVSLRGQRVERIYRETSWKEIGDGESAPTWPAKAVARRRRSVSRGDDATTRRRTRSRWRCRWRPSGRLRTDSRPARLSGGRRVGHAVSWWRCSAHGGRLNA